MDSSEIIGTVFLVAGALVVLAEIHTLTVYLLAVAVGAFAAGGSALAGASATVALAILAVVVMLGLPVAHWWRGKLKNRAAEDLMNDDVGRTVTVVDLAGNGLRVRYRGTTWSARLSTAGQRVPAVGDRCVITRREGNLLWVACGGDQ